MTWPPDSSQWLESCFARHGFWLFWTEARSTGSSNTLSRPRKRLKTIRDPKNLGLIYERYRTLPATQFREILVPHLTGDEIDLFLKHRSIIIRYLDSIIGDSGQCLPKSFSQNPVTSDIRSSSFFTQRGREQGGKGEVASSPLPPCPPAESVLTNA